MNARYFASNRPYSLLFVSQKYGRQISGSESGFFIAVARPEIWTPGLLPKIGHFLWYFEA